MEYNISDGPDPLMTRDYMDRAIREQRARMETNKAVRKYAVISGQGHCAASSRVWSAHSTASAALRAARNPAYMVISSEGGFSKGENVYMDMIGSVYSAVSAR